MSAFDTVLERVRPGAELRTPDLRTGKPFKVVAADAEGVSVRTARGGFVRISLFTFDSAVKYLSDLDCSGDRWLETKDEHFQALLNMENDRVRAASYVIAILGHAGLVDIDGNRPNKVRLSAPAS